jgi:RND family efflux transporter MFP subunit
MITMSKSTIEESAAQNAGAGSRMPRSIAAGTLLLLVLAGAAIAVAVRTGISTRAKAESSLARRTEDTAIPVVSVVHPKEGAPVEEIVLPGNAQALSETPIYARTSGYLRRWYFDIGAKVKHGDLLAEIDTPEVEKELQEARSQLENALAGHHLAETTAERWKSLLQSEAVSRQETDEKVADAQTKKATVDANRSNVLRLEDLQSFQKVYAPFDGVITARNTDIGALIDAGANSVTKELFHLAAIQTLRVFVAVPEIYSRASQEGTVATLTLEEYPGRSFRGVLARTSNSIDPATHTILTEIDVDNSNGELLPGAYVSVHLKLPRTTHSVVIPSNTLLFRSEGLQVAVVRAGRVLLVPIRLGHDYGTTVEVTSGVASTDNVILDPADSLASGVPVRLSR